MTTVPTIERLRLALARLIDGTARYRVPVQPDDDDQLLDAALGELAELRERQRPAPCLSVGPADGCMCGGDLVEVDDRRQAYPWRWFICRKCGGATTNSGKYLPPDSGFGLPRLGDATTVEIGVERREAAPTTAAPIVEAARNYVAAIRSPAPDPADEADRDAWEDEIETTQAALVAAVLAAASPSLRAGVPR